MDHSNPRLRELIMIFTLTSNGIRTLVGIHLEGTHLGSPSINKINSIKDNNNRDNNSSNNKLTNKRKHTTTIKIKMENPITGRATTLKIRNNHLRTGLRSRRINGRSTRNNNLRELGNTKTIRIPLTLIASNSKETKRITHMRINNSKIHLMNFCVKKETL